ncbi:MAG: proteasome accessory factor PafA2 family protein [Armatimonadota bacterium]
MGHLLKRIMGLETEYGLMVEGEDPSGLPDAAAEIVRSYEGPSANSWDYRCEDPRRDARGFRAASLAVNPEDLKYDQMRPKRVPHADLLANRVLPNGARLYNDHGHPEYSTPECASVADLVAHDKAGERIVFLCAQAYSSRMGRRVLLYKNNTDYHGMSYGCHEDYLVPREVPFDRILAALLPFLVTRQIYTGAGKVGIEQSSSSHDGIPLQLSQRADFFTEVASIDTLHRRPIINTRDEPHATPERYRRLHVICGDANMMEFATALKVGTTSLVLSLIEDGWLPPFELADPVHSIKAISRDQTLKWEVQLTGRRHTSALEVQNAYLESAQSHLAGASAETDWLLDAWRAVLEGLGKDPMSLRDRLDWPAKRHMIAEFLSSVDAFGDLHTLQALDLEYHNLDPGAGLFRAVEKGVYRVVSDDDILTAMRQPPSDTRAYLRGLCVTRFGSLVRSVTWSRLSLDVHGGIVVLDMSDMVDGRTAVTNTAAARATSLSEFLSAVAGGTNHSDP